MAHGHGAQSDAVYLQGPVESGIPNACDRCGLHLLLHHREAERAGGEGGSSGSALRPASERDTPSESERHDEAISRIGCRAESCASLPGGGHLYRQPPRGIGQTLESRVGGSEVALGREHGRAAVLRSSCVSYIKHAQACVSEVTVCAEGAFAGNCPSQRDQMLGRGREATHGSDAELCDSLRMLHGREWGVGSPVSLLEHVFLRRQRDGISGIVDDASSLLGSSDEACNAKLDIHISDDEGTSKTSSCADGHAALHIDGFNGETEAVITHDLQVGAAANETEIENNCIDPAGFPSLHDAETSCVGAGARKTVSDPPAVALLPAARFSSFVGKCDAALDQNSGARRCADVGAISAGSSADVGAIRAESSNVAVSFGRGQR